MEFSSGSTCLLNYYFQNNDVRSVKLGTFNRFLNTKIWGKSRNERMMGAKNAQLFCVTGSSPRQPSTPQLLRILEETIQKKTPKALFPKTVVPVKDAERYRMSFNIPERVTENLFQYRTKFVQHMLTSTMYANSDIGKPWEKIGSVSEQIIDELLLNCAKEMELQHYVKSLYESETC